MTTSNPNIHPLLPESGPRAHALAVSALAIMAVISPASAQQAAQGTAVELPPVVVQGATLQPPKQAKPAASGDDEAPAPQPRPKPAPRKAPAASDSASTGTGSAQTPSPTVSDGAGGGGAAFGEGAAGQGGDSAGGESVAGQPLDRVGSAVTVVTGEQLRAQQIRSAGEALRSLPGVEVNKTGGLAGVTQVRIRGADAHHTLVVVDGIVANSGTDGEFDFADLMAEDIERIEVIRGPQSALYGSGALGGVVNIVTRSGRGPMTMAGRVEGGAHGTTDLAARVSGGTDKVWASATIHERKTSGFNIAPDAAMNENDGSKMTTIAANGGFRPFSGVELTFTARRTQKDVARDDQTANSAGSNRNGLIVASDSVSRQDGTVTLLGAQARWDTMGGALTNILKVNRNVTERNDISLADFGFGIFPSKFANTSEVDTLAYQSTYRFATPMFLSAKHAFTWLVERESQDFTPNSDGADGAKHERGRMSFAGEWQGEFLNRLDLVAGVRHDDNDTMPDYTTWRSSASLRLPEINLRPHASVGTAVKLPSQFEQFGTASNFVSNSALRAEKSFGWDAGVEVTVIRDKAIIDITYFEANLTDKITAQYASIFDANPAFACHAGDFFCSRSINLDGVSRRHGLETSGRFALLPGVSVGLAYTRLIAQDSTQQEEKRRPPNTARGDLTYLFAGGRGKISLAAVYNGEMKDTAFVWPTFSPVVTTLDDYWLVNVGASYKISPSIEIYGRVENALDSKYEETFGFNTAGIAGYAGVKFMLQAPVSTVASRE